MVEPESLKPEEVLAHLNALGYYDIKPKQLKEFVHDLKKLIKYDQKRLHSSHVELQTSKTHSCDYASCSGSDDNSDKLSSNDSYESSVCSSTATYKQDEDSKYDESDKNSIKNGVNLERVQSSFIRPWNVPVNLSARNRKNPDPVKLYHQYKELWNRFNIPGESKHSDLRWGIRNRMLGQEPHPRVVI